MSIFKCKMCGGSLEVSENQSIVVCDYCGTQQTLPKLDNDKKVALFTRANNLRIKCEFDKAAGIYESIIAEFRDEAEAYWGLVLCKYGIEYVEDGKGRRIPTCHRTLPTSIMEDDDFQQACENADISARNIYREEAKAIDKIQKKILSIALNEEPYDIFICYKEQDDVTGSRTEDSSIAQDIYTQLIKVGYKVFFARDSLRDVAGTEYEPYIYAALSSARVMLAIGTRYEYYDAVWVKNEWSRFISMMAEDNSKTLIPCYRNMDAYDMPAEFKNMQALDMGEVTFFASLTTNINRLLPKEKPTVKETVVINTSNARVEPLLKRAFMFLEDGDWERADEFCEQVLNIEPENAQAYLCKLLADLKISRLEDLTGFRTSFSDNINYKKIMRFGSTELKEEVKKCNDIIVRRNEEARKKDIYEKALNMMEHATTEEMYENAGFMFQEVKEYADAKEKSEECFELGEIARKDAIYFEAKGLMRGDNTSNYEEAIALFEEIPGWKDSDEQIPLCRKRIEEIKEKEETEKLEAERRLEEEKRLEKERLQREAVAKDKKLKKIAIAASVMAVFLVFLVILNTVIIPGGKYNDAVALVNAGKRQEAIAVFSALGNFKDSKEQLSKIMNQIAVRETISAGSDHTVGLKSDGTVVAVGWNVGGQCNVNHWGNIVAISAGKLHTVALKADGTVVAVGKNTSGQCDVSDWTDIVAVSADGAHTVGLKADGTVIATGYNNNGVCNVQDWENVISISVSGDRTVGLKSDGTVVAVGYNKYGQCNVSDWTDIVAISAGSDHTVGLKSDGTVVAVGNNGDGQCDVDDWTDIVAVSTGTWKTVGLKSDGTVVAVGSYSFDVEDWTDIVAISASDHIVGIKSDGTVVADGWNDEGQCNVEDWKDIKLPNTNN